MVVDLPIQEKNVKTNRICVDWLFCGDCNLEADYAIRHVCVFGPRADDLDWYWPRDALL